MPGAPRESNGQPDKHCSLLSCGNHALCLVLAVTSAWAKNNPSAYEALRVVGTQLNRDMVNRVISVTGVDGDPQPRRGKF